MALRAIVISMMVHETNTFSPVPTPLESFHPLVGGVAIAKFKASDTGLDGFLDVAPPTTAASRTGGHDGRSS